MEITILKDDKNVLKRLLSEDFRKMELRIFDLEAGFWKQEAEYRTCEESKKSFKEEWVRAKDRFNSSLSTLKEKSKQLEDYGKEIDELKLKIREQSEADLLFATLKITNETVFKEKPDIEELNKFQEMRDQAVMALQAQSMTGLRNGLVKDMSGPGVLGRLFGL